MNKRAPVTPVCPGDNDITHSMLSSMEDYHFNLDEYVGLIFLRGHCRLNMATTVIDLFVLPPMRLLLSLDSDIVSPILMHFRVLHDIC